jgi:hypothetical protein
MQKTTVYIEDETAIALKQLAQTQNRSQAEIIREALASYVGTCPKSLPKGIGAYRSGRSDISEKAEELLAEAARKTR